MSKMGILRLLLTFTLVAAVVSGCGTKNNNATPSQSDKAASGQGKKSFKVGLVTGIGGVHDNSFNQAGWEALQKAQTILGIEAKYTESKSEADAQPDLVRFARDKYDLIWGMGSTMGDSLTNAAKSMPDSKFAIVDSDLGGNIPANVAALTFKDEEGSFLMGVIAGLSTKSNKVGFIGGMKFPVIEKFEYGFRAGVKTVNPQAEVVVNYVGAFNRPDQGKTFAATMYDSGVDIIYQGAGATGEGVFAEAKERKNVWVIGTDKDQSNLAPDQTLSSMIRRVDVGVFNITKQLTEGAFPGGKESQLGVKEDGVGLAASSDKHVPKEILDKAANYRQQIIDGKIKVPGTEKEFK
ncbi:BMP family ABC transporter substrate-binding protein [Paenibacillus marchantiophytorum]|uniref:BMP family ABC transporter substrate-binding protein n=1 Tax=Paenibacillus marchantiophytorum TaxID=1619310 RepID=A0ABQ1EQK9_9BACL|nr:BMP family ABC transporter substrate-binding protein [Paenibacillus marchantiophytorum]GFZ82699.1 BMP family ABC transporter substrate-binding protein [Paenibacillus marchantiophytorum]